ncbi:MAG: hypothetical protein ABIY35_04120 [Chitinophagaceae bacterium]
MDLKTYIVDRENISYYVVVGDANYGADQRKSALSAGKLLQEFLK